MEYKIRYVDPTSSFEYMSNDEAIERFGKEFVEEQLNKNKNMENNTTVLTNEIQNVDEAAEYFEIKDLEKHFCEFFKFPNDTDEEKLEEKFRAIWMFYDPQPARRMLFQWIKEFYKEWQKNNSKVVVDEDILKLALDYSNEVKSEYGEITFKAREEIYNGYLAGYKAAIQSSTNHGTFSYLKSEQERQIILMKALGINYPDNGYTFEQCINTVLFMAAEGKNKIQLTAEILADFADYYYGYDKEPFKGNIEIAKEWMEEQGIKQGFALEDIEKAFDYSFDMAQDKNDIWSKFASENEDMNGDEIYAALKKQYIQSLSK